MHLTYEASDVECIYGLLTLKNVIYCAIFKGSNFKILWPVKNILTRFSIVVNRIGMTCGFLLASS